MTRTSATDQVCLRAFTAHVTFMHGLVRSGCCKSLNAPSALCAAISFTWTSAPKKLFYPACKLATAPSAVGTGEAFHLAKQQLTA